MAETDASFRTGAYRPPHTPKEDLDRALVALKNNSQVWVDLPVDDKIRPMQQARQDFRKVWDRWAASLRGSSYPAVGA